MGVVDLSKQLEIFFLFVYSPQLISVLNGTDRGTEPHLCRQPSKCCSSDCHQRQRQGQLPLSLGGSMSWTEELRSCEPALPSCDYSQAANLFPHPVHQKGTGLLSKQVPASSRQEKDHVFIELSTCQKQDLADSSSEQEALRAAPAPLWE